jgi:uncharacterized membrane protein YkoI
MKKIAIFLTIVLFSGLSISAKPKYIGMKRAKQLALQQVKGTIKSSELEKEHGKMIYSFDIRNRKGGITEVNIDARTGKILVVEVESKTKEKAEEAKEKKKP